MPPISAFIITYNNAHEIATCLRSIDWVDEIVCVDSLSTDGTPDICSSMGARVISQPFLGYYQQLRFAEAHCSHDWALNLYADETVSPELRDEIQKLFATDPPADGYMMPRRNYMHKRWISTAGYYPSWHLRLFRRSKGTHLPRILHQKIRVKGKVRKLRGAIDHWCWARDGEMLDNLLEYAWLEASELADSGRRIGSAHFVIPAWSFLKRFLLKGGWRQGTLGAVVSARAACALAMRLMLAWEMQNHDWLEKPDPVWLSARGAWQQTDAPKPR